jgi:hypothetical protein
MPTSFGLTSFFSSIGENNRAPIETDKMGAQIESLNADVNQKKIRRIELVM